MADMRPADPSGPTVELDYDTAAAVYNYPSVAYDAASFTPGAPTMKPV